MEDLRAKTFEQQCYVESLVTSCDSIVVDPYGTGCYIDDYVSFDDMAAIVDYLRSIRPPLTELTKGGEK